MTTEPQPDLLGETLPGGWQIVRHIGRGAMGDVYEARHTEDGPARAAVKVLHDELRDHHEIAFRFRREAEILESIRSPHVPRLFDRGKDERGRPFLVMELLAGRELSRILDETWPLEPLAAVEIARQICSAMTAAHVAGIVHRDLKPDNIMVSGPLSQPDVKVLDFGVSKVEDVALTNAGAIIGTPAYMAPEQALGGESTPLVDVYAVGATLYEMLSGSAPYEESEPGKTLAALLSGPPPSLRSLNPKLSEALEEVVAKAMARDAGGRFSSMVALESELGMWAAQERAALTYEEHDRPTLANVTPAAPLPRDPSWTGVHPPSMRPAAATNTHLWAMAILAAITVLLLLAGVIVVLAH